MGRYFEDFVVDDVFVTPARTITDTDIRVFAALTEDFNPVHVDPDFAARSIFGECIAHGPMMVGITFGLLSKLDLLDGTVVALKAVEWSFNAPVRPNDEVHVRARVAETRRSRSVPDQGVVRFAIEIINQHDETVQTGVATAIVLACPRHGMDRSQKIQR